MKKSAEPGLFKRLKAGLEDGIRFARGELNLRTTEIPERPPELEAPDIVGLRRRFRMSQGVFAGMLNVSPKTIQSWEQGERKPSQAALRLLQIMRAEPTIVCQIVGVPFVEAATPRRK
jgi:putative transcriptional regulator